jgi:hypothetical protein
MIYHSDFEILELGDWEIAIPKFLNPPIPKSAPRFLG